jgi:ADP-heptose:LPS heptosyltransferase
VLQQEPEREAPFEIGGEARVEPVDELAAAIRALDLLISVDSLPAHLGGALGVPTWTLRPAEADWRWMRERDDTPWYPTMRLFRQASRGDWSSVVRRVAGELARLAR